MEPHTMEAELQTKNGHALKSEIEAPIAEFAAFLRHAADRGEPQSLRAWMDMAEAYRITQALQDCRGNRSAAARMLGIGRRTLYAKMDKLGITPSWSIQS